MDWSSIRVRSTLVKLMISNCKWCSLYISQVWEDIMGFKGHSKRHIEFSYGLDWGNKWREQSINARFVRWANKKCEDTLFITTTSHTRSSLGKNFNVFHRPIAYLSRQNYDMGYSMTNSLSIANLIALSHPMSASSLAQVFIDFTYKLHGFPSYIVSDRDTVLTSTFCRELMNMLGIQ